MGFEAEEKRLVEETGTLLKLKYASAFF